MTGPTNPAPWPRVLGSCYPPCPGRREALFDEIFLPAKSLGGWIFKDGPFRRQQEGIKWQAAYYGVADHTGEPVVYTVCPFCGSDLPIPPNDEGLTLEGEDGG